MEEGSSMPECLQQEPQQCRTVHINAKVPIEWALPLYGFLMPLIVAITILTNSFIVIVLSHRSLRTPTNYVLGAMAITELLTGLMGLPWLLYYYTFGGYQTDEWEGLPAFWCASFPYLVTSLPSIFHTVREYRIINDIYLTSSLFIFLAAIWLTVYLAVQRYIYICVPKLVQSLCTIRRSKQVIVSICMLSLWVYAPELFASYNRSFLYMNPTNNRTRSICVTRPTALMQMVGNNLYHMLLYAVHTIIVHTLPCILLVFFTWRLIAAIREADKKHSNLVGKGNQQQRKCTVVTTHDERLLAHRSGGVGNCYAAVGNNHKSSSSNGTSPILLAGRRSSSLEDESVNGGVPTLTADMPTTITNGGGTSASTTTTTRASLQQRGSLSESKRMQGLRQNTRMLLAVILLFLVTEIPAALIFGMHVGAVALKFTFLQQRHYAIINKLLIVRNVLIVVSYPLRFAIYCGMSAQFREVVQQMLAKRKMLFQHFSYGKLRSSGNGGGDMRRMGSGERGRRSDLENSSASFLPRKTSTLGGMIVQQQQQKESVIWRNNGTGGAAVGGGRKVGDGIDEMTTPLMKMGDDNDGGACLTEQTTTTTVTIGHGGNENDAAEEDKRRSDEEETDELDECKL